MRKVVIATVVALFSLTAAATAAAPLWTGSLNFTSKKAGTSKKPSPLGFTFKLNSTVPNGTLSPVTQDVKLKVYGMKVDGKHFPTCSLNKIAAAHNDNVCPKKAMVADGAISAVLSGTALPQPAACDPHLHVWNSGQGKLTYFFTTDASHSCLGGALKTGGTPPYGGTYKTQGGFFLSDVKIPNAINYPTAGLVGSLFEEHLKFTTQTTHKNGKKYISQASVACKGKKRPYSIIDTTKPIAGGPNTVTTITSSAPCSK